MFSGRQQTRARERVLNRTLHSNTRDSLQDSLQGGTRFLFGLGAQEYTLGDEPGLWSSRTCSDRDLAVLTAF